jgi:hypothetical protein
MGDETQRTDYFPPEVYAAHANWAKWQGGGFYQQRLKPLVVPFDANFDHFAANVAFAIRHYVVYRTDGGRFARGLVRDSGQLQTLHHDLLYKAKVPNGQKVKLEAILWRRKDPVPTRRWSMTIEFALSATSVDADEDVVEVSPTLIAKNEKAFVETVLHEAGLVAHNIDRHNHNQGERVIKMVEIAERLGYPRCLDLWYYGPNHVGTYLALLTTDDYRKTMTAQTGGNFEFDGWPMQGEGQSWGGHEWRAFPFKYMVKLCRGRDPDERHGYINNVLLIADRDINASISKANEIYQRSQATSAAVYGPLWAKFYNHLQSVQTSPDNLLWAFKQKSRVGGFTGWLTGAP